MKILRSSKLRQKRYPKTVIIKRTETAQTREKWVGWTQVVANILVPLTLIVAVASLVLQTQQNKSDASSRQVELFYSEGIVEAQSVIFSVLSEDDIRLLAGEVTRSFVNEIIAGAIERNNKETHEIISSILTITVYFDQVEACIRELQCSEIELNYQVGQYGRDFYCIYQGQIDVLRKRYFSEALGFGASQFAQRQGGCE